MKQKLDSTIGFARGGTLWETICKYTDLFILILVITFLIYDLIFVFIYLNQIIYKFYSSLGNVDTIFNMVDNINTPASHSTDVRVVHDDGNWSNTIKSLFIYGTGALRLQLARGGTPASRTFIIVSTIATDAAAKFVNNTINDPTFVRSHIENWSAIWKNGNDGVAEVRLDTETSKKMGEALNSTNNTPAPGAGVHQPGCESQAENITASSSSSSTETVVNKFAAAPQGMEDISNKMIKYIMETIRPILEPVTSNYSNEVLANQIYDLSILLFILSILISILILGLLINILVVINSNRILNLFSNKYIKWYVNINMKLISIEVFCLGFSILYFMHTLSKGLQYIATHPIIFN